MRKVIRAVWHYTMIAICLATLVIGLSIFGAFVAYQIIDWKQSREARNTSNKVAEIKLLEEQLEAKRTELNKF